MRITMKYFEKEFWSFSRLVWSQFYEIEQVSKLEVFF